MPKVSVIIPNYNHAKYLDKRIQSILNQTYQDFEIIYLDDASKDNSNEVFSKYSDNPRIQAIYNDINSGSPFKQWNKGIKNANGEYIWIAESDDYANKELLATLVGKLDKNPTVGIAYCQSYIVDEHDNTIGTCKEWIGYSDKERWTRDFINFGEDECANHLIFANTIPNASAVLIRREIYEKVGYATENMRLCGDWMLWIKMLLISNIAFVAEPLNYFRKHSGTVRHKTSVNGVEIRENYQLLNYILKNVNCSQEIAERACEALFYRWLNTIFSKEGEIPLSVNYQIYRIASTVDSRIHYRFARQIILGIFWKLKWRVKQIPPVRLIMRHIKHIQQF